MKTRAYVKVAKSRKGTKLEASTTPSYRPIMQGGIALPTVYFAIDLNLPDDVFEPASQVVAEITIPKEALFAKAQVETKTKGQLVAEKLGGAK